MWQCCQIIVKWMSNVDNHTVLSKTQIHTIWTSTRDVKEYMFRRSSKRQGFEPNNKCDRALHPRNRPASNFVAPWFIASRFFRTSLCTTSARGVSRTTQPEYSCWVLRRNLNGYLNAICWCVGSMDQMCSERHSECSFWACWHHGKIYSERTSEFSIWAFWHHAFKHIQKDVPIRKIGTCPQICSTASRVTLLYDLERKPGWRFTARLSSQLFLVLKGG